MTGLAAIYAVAVSVPVGHWLAVTRPWLASTVPAGA